MRKAQKLTRVLSLVLVLSLCFGLLATSGLKLTARAADTTVEFTTADFVGKGTTSTGSEVSVTKEGVTVEASLGYGHADNFRIYTGSTLVISANTNITKVEITCTVNGDAKYGPGCLAGDGYTFLSDSKVGTWNGAATSISLTSSKQVRMTSIVVTLAGSSEGGDTPTPATGNTYALTTELKDGDEVVIYNPGHGKAIKNETEKDWYLVAQEVAPADNKITTDDATIVWKVTKNADDSCSFTNGENAITAWLSGTYVELTNNASYEGGCTSWKVTTTGTDGLFYVSSSELTTSYGDAYIECYQKSGVDKICGYSTGTSRLTEKDYGFQFYVKEATEAPHTHAWGEGVVTEQPTCTKEGVKTYTCECGETKTETIAKLDHVDANNDGRCDACDADLTAATSIADAVKAEKDTVVTNVTGVVTFIEVGTNKSNVDWTNVYIQDAKGENGICVRVEGKQLTNKVGDTLTVVTGKRDDYNGLKQIKAAPEDVKTVDASADKIELKANETTLDKLTEADLCTYVYIKGLKVTAVEDTKITVEQNGKEMPIYKAVLGDTKVNVGDTLEFKGALSTFNGFQLRNTSDTEIKVTATGTGEPQKPEDKPDETNDSTYVLATEVKDGDKIILVNAASNKALSTALNEAGYPAGVNVVPQSSKITTGNANIVWTVKVVDGGLQLVNAKGETLSCKSGLKYGAEGNVWVFEFDGKTLKVKSATETGKSGDPKYLEWYADKGNFSTYYLNNSQGEPNDPALFAMNVYVLDPDATPVKPSGNPGTADNAQLVLAGVVMVMAVAAAAALVTQRKKSF